MPRPRRLVLALALLTMALAAPAQAAPADRAAALDQYLAVGDAQAVDAGWTGDVAGCVTGTESDASIAATLTAVNTLRSFAGLDPVTFDPELNRKALAAALMMRAGNNLSHYPGTDWPCYSQEGADGAANSNLFLGRSGAAAMPGYVIDSGVPSLGHRRWLLNPEATTFGTGSTGTTNALWVLGATAADPNVPALIAWPPTGHVPWDWFAGGEWSAAITPPSGGVVDLSQAQVTVTIGGRVADVYDVIDMGDGYGAGPMLKWWVELTEPDVGGDRRIDVKIDGVTVDAAPYPITYTVDAMYAAPPLPVEVDGDRAASAISLRWPAATERGVPVTGYRVVVRETDPSAGPVVTDLRLPATARATTVPHGDRTKVLWAQVVPQSRAGAANTTRWMGFGPPPILPVQSTKPLPGAIAGPAGFLKPPTLTAPRKVRKGSRLRAKATTMNAVAVRYQWLRQGRRIKGATRSSYRVTARDRGKRLSCRVTAVGANGKSSSALTPAVLVRRR